MRNNKQKLAVVIALVMAVVGLSIGFAVFSSTLNIQSRASVNPTNNFNVKFASSISTTDQGLTYQDNTENYPVSKSATGNSTASNATIDNTLEYPTISNLNATFTQPGESVQYTFYVVNVGEYDAYLTNLVFNNAQGSSTFKDCVANASSDNPASNASSVCNNINLSVKLGNENPVQETTTFNNHLLEKNNFETVIVTISYTGEIYADGEVNVSFGDIELHYSTVDEPIQIATSEVSPIDDANYLYTYIYDAPVTYTISENCESLLINEAELSTSDAASLCSGTVNNLILNVFHVDEENLAYPYAVSLAAALGGLDQESEGSIIGVSLEGMREVPQVLNIPSTINGLPVLKIGIGFNENEILSLTIPNTVQEIALSAFQKCNLSSIDFSNATSLQTIGIGAFAYNNLMSVTLPDSVTTIASGAFSYNNLTSVEIGTNNSQITLISEDAFSDSTETDEDSGITYGPNAITSIRIHKQEGSISLSNTGLDNGATIIWN